MTKATLLYGNLEPRVRYTTEGKPYWKVLLYFYILVS